MARAHQLPFLAAAIAYYTFVAVVPLLIVGFAVTSALAGEALADRIVMAVGEFLTPEASSLLESALLGAVFAGLVLLVGAALNVMRRPYETGNYNNHRYEYPSNEGP